MASTTTLSKLHNLATALGYFTAAGSIAIAWFFANVWTFALAAGMTVLAVMLGSMVRRTKQVFSEMELIAQEHRIMLESISDLPESFSVYDANDRLVAWNESYEAMYGDAFAKLSKKTDHNAIFYADLIRETAPESVDAKSLQAHIDERVALQKNANGQTQSRHYPDVGWQRVTKYKTPAGAIATLSVDISEQKLKEAELLKEIERRKAMELKLHTLGNVDALTGMMSRRAFLNQVSNEIERSCRYDNPMCVLIVDIDQLSLVNEEHGHMVGDQIIALVAQSTEEQLRNDVDVIGRLGTTEGDPGMLYDDLKPRCVPKPLYWPRSRCRSSPAQGIPASSIASQGPMSPTAV